jgi:hypothetical protein
MPLPVPTDSLSLLYQTACGDTGGSQVARAFLFWLAGLPNPTGFFGEGGLEQRRFDPRHINAAVEVFTWWINGVESDNPLLEILGRAIFFL